MNLLEKSPGRKSGERLLMESKVLNILKELKIGLSRTYGDRLKGVFLFGSYARGEQDKESDFDVLVIIDEFSAGYGTEVTRTGQLTSDLSLKYGISISKVFLREKDWTQAENPFLFNVRQEVIAA